MSSLVLMQGIVHCHFGSYVGNCTRSFWPLCRELSNVMLALMQGFVQCHVGPYAGYCPMSFWPLCRDLYNVIWVLMPHCHRLLQSMSMYRNGIKIIIEKKEDMLLIMRVVCMFTHTVKKIRLPGQLFPRTFVPPRSLQGAHNRSLVKIQSGYSFPNTNVTPGTITFCIIFLSKDGV